MTTIQDVKVICSNCGTQSQHGVLGSTNQFGSPDLDLRPPEMARSTMAYWLQECPGCGLIAPQLSDTWDGDGSLLTSADYLATRNDPSLPPLARRFKCRALIAGADEESFGAMLRAAWVADDAGLTEAARSCRRQAASYLENKAGLSPELRLGLLDVLRRCGSWESAGRLGDDLSLGQLSEPLPAIVAFQMSLIHRRDEGCYVVMEATTAARNK